jgi:hypothetical protein
LRLRAMNTHYQNTKQEHILPNFPHQVPLPNSTRPC